jgi:hypothetical protein
MENPERRKPLGRPSLRWRIILRWIFEKWDGEAWTRSIWLRIGTVVNAVMNPQVP